MSRPSFIPQQQSDEVVKEQSQPRTKRKRRTKKQIATDQLAIIEDKIIASAARHCYKPGTGKFKSYRRKWIEIDNRLKNAHKESTT